MRLKKRRCSIKYFLLLMFAFNAFASDTMYQRAEELNYNNTFLDKNSESNLIAYVMLDFQELKHESKNNFESKKHLENLTLLAIEYHKIPFKDALEKIKESVKSSTNPVSLLKKIKLLF